MTRISIINFVNLHYFFVDMRPIFAHSVGAVTCNNVDEAYDWYAEPDFFYFNVSGNSAVSKYI